MAIVALAVVILALSLVGGLAPRLFAARLTDQQLQDMTGVASGLLLASALLVVIPEGFHIAAEGSGATAVFTDEPVVLGVAVLLGFVCHAVARGSGVRSRRGTRSITTMSRAMGMVMFITRHRRPC